MLRLRQKRIVPIALPAGAWFWLWQIISPSDSGVRLLPGGTDGSPRARQRIGAVFGVRRVVPVVCVAVSGSSLASVYPNPFLSLLSSRPGFCSGINGTKKRLEMSLLESATICSFK